MSDNTQLTEEHQNWLREQRRLYHEGKLKPWQIRKMEQLPGWTWGEKPDPTFDAVKKLTVDAITRRINYDNPADPMGERAAILEAIRDEAEGCQTWEQLEEMALSADFIPDPKLNAAIVNRCLPSEL